MVCQRRRWVLKGGRHLSVCQRGCWVPKGGGHWPVCQRGCWALNGAGLWDPTSIGERNECQRKRWTLKRGGLWYLTSIRNGYQSHIWTPRAFHDWSIQVRKGKWVPCLSPWKGIMGLVGSPFKTIERLVIYPVLHSQNHSFQVNEKKINK